MGTGSPTASQTAWAMLGLIAAGRASSAEAVSRGIEYLLETQSPDGTWDEASVHRHRLPPRLLSQVPSLPGLLPADGDRPLSRTATGRPAAATRRLPWRSRHSGAAQCRSD